MATTWTIARRQGVCTHTGSEFADGERHVSLLMVQDGALERLDLSMDAWHALRERIDDDGDEQGEPLFWWMTRHEAVKKKTVQLDVESLDALFVQLEGREELQVRELRYVLCLLLMRKRRVKVEKVLRENGEESFIVKRPRDEQRYKVFVYDFEPERLDQVRAQLQAVFDGAEGPHGIRLGDDAEEYEEASEGADQGPDDEEAAGAGEEQDPVDESVDEEA